MSAPDIDVPRDETDAADIVRAARRRLSIVGGGSRTGLGHPCVPARTISTRLLTGVTLYEPTEMVISARAGTPLREVEDLLAENGQMLAFEPMDHRPLFGSSGEPTIGAVAACNVSGPGRLRAGSARDALLGLRMINGFGETIRSGGRVMKNVTGLDLARLACGAHGTLGLITEVTFRTQPRPATSSTLAWEGLSDRQGVALMSSALGSPFSVSCAAHLPGRLAEESPLTLLRIDGFANSVAHRIDGLRRSLQAFGEFRLSEDDGVLWDAVRDAVFLAQPRSRAVWRVSLKATDAPSYVESLTGAIAFTHFYDWAGGLVWIAVEGESECGARAIRERLARFGGHATLVRAPGTCDPRTQRFHPLSEAEMRLSRSVKASFDPDGKINHGRMYPGC